MKILKSLQYVIRKFSDSLSFYRSKWHRQCIGRIYNFTLSRLLFATHEHVLDFLKLFLCDIMYRIITHI